MRLSGTRTGDLLDAVAAYCERLVKTTVRDPSERLRQRRLIGLALVAPFVVAVPAANLLPTVIGVSTTLLVVAAIFGISFVAAASVIATGRAILAETTLLVCGLLAVASMVALTGGTGAPATLVIGALVFEAWWVGRTRKALAVGFGAMLVALSLQALLAARFAIDIPAPSTASWLMPVCYLALVVPRLAAWLEERTQGEEESASLEEIIEAVVMRLDLSGEVKDVSEQARRLLGLAPELLLSTGLLDRLHVADKVAYLCALADMKEKEGFRRIDVRIRVPGAAGSAIADYRWFAIEMMRPTTADSTITVLVRPENERSVSHLPDNGGGDADEKIGIASTRVLAAVSHELRTPLNSIIGFSDMMLHGMAGSFADPRQKEYVGLVRESGDHLLSVVNSILDMSRMEAGGYATNPEPFRFTQAVDMCQSMLAQQAIAKKLDLRTDVATEIGEIYADKRAVKQILINLVSNAIKFTPEGGTVSIGAKRVGSRVHFWVSDTGIGMGADDLARVGEPFVQIRNDLTRYCEGAGLGLSLVKGLVALHSGTMSIESEPGLGTRVTISLPVSRPKQEAATDLAEIHAQNANRLEEAYDGPFRKSA